MPGTEGSYRHPAYALDAIGPSPLPASRGSMRTRLGDEPTGPMVDRLGMQYRCAWCRERARAGAGPVSHGICAACAERMLTEYRETSRPSAARTARRSDLPQKPIEQASAWVARTRPSKPRA